MQNDATNAPEWRDAPTCVGNWRWVDGNGFLDGGELVEQDLPVATQWGIRWFGPIPADTNKVVTDAIESIRPVVEEAFRNA